MEAEKGSGHDPPLAPPPKKVGIKMLKPLKSQKNGPPKNLKGKEKKKGQTHTTPTHAQTRIHPATTHHHTPQLTRPKKINVNVKNHNYKLKIRHNQNTTTRRRQMKTKHTTTKHWNNQKLTQMTQCNDHNKNAN